MAKPKVNVEDLFAKRFEEYNSKVLEEIAKTIKKFNGLNYTQANQLANQLKYDRSYIDLVDELVKLTGKSKKEIRKILEETVKQHIDLSEVFFKAKGLNKPIFEEDAMMQNMVNTMAIMSEGDFVNIARSTGFAFLDSEKHIQFLNMRDTFYKVIDECVYAISEGKESYDRAVRRIIKQLTASGVRRIVYANEGKRVYTQRIDTAVRRTVKDSIRQISLEAEKEVGKRFGADGVEITVHLNPAPDHMFVQGHIFKMEEFDKFQNDEDCEDINGNKYPAISEETGRDRRSIEQYNCYHHARMIVIGVSRPWYTQEYLDEIIRKNEEGIVLDGKHYTGYEATQLQRSIETEIRIAKDAHNSFKEVGDREGMIEEQIKITQLKHKYQEIVKQGKVSDQLKQRATVSGYRPIRTKKE